MEVIAFGAAWPFGDCGAGGIVAGADVTDGWCACAVGDDRPPRAAAVPMEAITSARTPAPSRIVRRRRLGEAGVS